MKQRKARRRVTLKQAAGRCKYKTQFNGYNTYDHWIDVYTFMPDESEGTFRRVRKNLIDQTD